MPKHYKATCCCTIHMPEDADTASKANPNDEEPLMQEGVTCAEAVCVEDLHRICALPDPRTLDNGLDLQARPFTSEPNDLSHMTTNSVTP